MQAYAVANSDSHASAHLYADPCTDVHSHTSTNLDTHASADPSPNANSYAGSDTAAYSNPNADWNCACPGCCCWLQHIGAFR